MVSAACAFFACVCGILFVVRAHEWSKTGRRWDAALAAFYLLVAETAAYATVVTA